MILLDTHIWVWWVNGAAELRERQRELIEEHELQGLGLSAISCWEVAKLIQKGRMELDRDVGDWIAAATSYPGLTLLPLTPEIAVASTRLPGDFHHDPADQIIVATARTLDLPLLTADAKLLAYPHVVTLR